jgi:3-dehydroquinate synthase
MATRKTVDVTVDLGARSYPIVIGNEVLGTVGERLTALGHRGRCGLVTGERVNALYGDRVRESLRAAGLDLVVDVELPDGEEHKSLVSLTVIYDKVLEVGVDRKTPLVALGGGVVGDLTGFAAATLLRGLPVVQLPTTLLAQVDSAIGGKTGVNHASGKNLIGAFHQPRFVLADIATLRTLPPRELRAGLAEVVKYGVIGDPELFATIEARADDVLGLEPMLMTEVVAACCRHKALVVSRDEREEDGERAVLNFGHTVGHGVEMLTDYRRFLHGEAVAIGMVAAARISHRLGACGGDVVGRIEALLGRLGLPTEVPSELERGALGRAMRSDKKSSAGRIRFVAVEEIGRVRFVELDAGEIAAMC